jgi:predicted Zn-dependent peptidase
MGWSVSGEKDTVAKIKRDDFVSYLDRLYRPNNMALVVAGKLSLPKIKKLADSYFGHLRKGSKNISKSVKNNQKRSKVEVVFKKTEQAHFCLGVPGYHYGHPDRFSLGVLATILGGGMSSRIFMEIREKRGLAYYADCLPDFYTDSGYFVARAGVRLEKIEESIKIIQELFFDLVKQKPSQKELNKAKEFLKGRLILALESSHHVATRYAGQTLLEDKIRRPKETLALIDKVTANDVQRIAKDIFKPEKLNLAVIGPYRSQARLNKILSEA